MMDEAEIQKAKSRIWREWERKYNLRRLPKEYKRKVEAPLDSDIGYDENPEVYEKDLEGIIQDELSRLALLFDSPGSPIGDIRKAGDTDNKHPKKRYRHTVDKRVQLADFVIEHYLSKVKNQRREERKWRIDWRGICAAWNEAYPNDQYIPNQLNAVYYRAIKDVDVLERLLVEGQERDVRIRRAIQTKEEPLEDLYLKTLHMQLKAILLSKYTMDALPPSDAQSHEYRELLLGVLRNLDSVDKSGYKKEAWN